MPVRTPGSRTTAGKPKYRSTIVRSSAVTRGTPDEIATPVIESSKENPWKPRNCCTMSASSSEVRSASVAMRQWSTRSLPRNSPTTVCVFPASMASSIGRQSSADVEADVEHAYRVRERADRDEVGAALGVRTDRVDTDPARHLDLRRALEDLDGLGH